MTPSFLLLVVAGELVVLYEEQYQPPTQQSQLLLSCAFHIPGAVLKLDHPVIPVRSQDATV